MQNDSTDWKHDKYDRESFSDETLPMVYLAHPGSDTYGCCPLKSLSKHAMTEGETCSGSVCTAPV